jgi:hypothetical protein
VIRRTNDSGEDNASAAKGEKDITCIINTRNLEALSGESKNDLRKRRIV